MQISLVTQVDGLNCARLLNALKIARFDNLTGKDIDELVMARKWLVALASDMGTLLRSPQPERLPDPVSTIKVKSVKPMVGLTKSKPKKKSK